MSAKSIDALVRLNRSRSLLAWLCAATVLACALGHAVVAAPLVWRGSAYIALHAVLTLLMFATWWCLNRDSSSAPLPQDLGLHASTQSTPSQQVPAHAQSLLWVLIAGVLCRLLLLDLPAFTTHDVQRYLWDGAVALAGLDPYRVAPDAAVSAPLRLIWPTPAEHAAYPTLYPPLALALFALSALAGPSAGIWVWKLFATAASIATLWLGYRWLLRRGTPQHLPLLAFSPLLLLELGIGAHVDAFSVLAVLAALSAFEARRFIQVGVWIGLGALFKLLPLVLVLPLAVALLAKRQWRSLLQMGSALLGALVAGYGLAIALGLQPIGSIGLLFQRWRFGSPVYAALESQFSQTTAAGLATVLLLLLLLLSSWRAWFLADKPLAGAIQLAIAAPLLISPVVFPWYLCALIPAILLQPLAALLVWVSVAPLSYEVLNAFDSVGIWAPAAWPLWAIGIAVPIAAVFDVLRVPAGSRVISSSSVLRD